MFHYTDKAGFNGIRSQRDWKFLARTPRFSGHPKGAYFSPYSPCTVNLANRLRIPARKTEFYFEFIASESDFERIRGGRGGHVLYSPEDYVVERLRQVSHGLSQGHSCHEEDEE